MFIRLRYEASDGFKKSLVYTSLAGARKGAADRVGRFPEIGSDYAASGDGVGTIRVVEGCTLKDLFPESE
jgi:hypothetical protein